MHALIREHRLAAGRKIQLLHGDLTTHAVDAIVNAANEHLAHGGGVAGAIVRRGGAVIQTESDTWIETHGRAAHDKPALTSAGRLPCKAVIHAVGPVWEGGSHNEEQKLSTAYRAALEMARTQGFASVAFPSISTGIFGFPVARGATLAMDTVEQFLTGDPGSVTLVQFVLIDEPTVGAFRREMERRWPST